MRNGGAAGTDDPPTLGSRAERLKAEGLFGREHQIAAINALLLAGGPAIAYLHGPRGTGKTALLLAAERRLGRRFSLVIRIRGSEVEPQPAAVLAALAARLGVRAPDLLSVVTALAAVPGGCLLIIDDFEELRLIETWVRRVLVPALPDTARLLLASNSPPPSSWAVDFGTLFLPVELGPLSRDAVHKATCAAGLDDRERRLVWTVSEGHPLALTLALHAARVGKLEQMASSSDLIDVLLPDDPAMREMVEASAVVRRVTRPLMETMCGRCSEGTFRDFSRLPMVQTDREGCFLPEALRRGLAGRIAAGSPDRYALLRKRAAGWLYGRLDHAGPAERWRYMADLLFLIEHGQVRDAFFPPEGGAPTVEPIGPADRGAVLAIAAMSTPADLDVLALWLDVLPHRAFVARSEVGEVLAFYIFARSTDDLTGLAEADRLLALFLNDFQTCSTQQDAIFVRAMTGAPGVMGKAAMAACMLDLKRAYFEHWSLSRVYTAADAEIMGAPVFRHLGFKPLRQPDGVLPGAMVLEFPASGLSGWIARLLGVSTTDQSGFAFMQDKNQIVYDGQILKLTPLESKVFGALLNHAPSVVLREKMIEEIWQRRFVGSNVVDTVVRSLRTKLRGTGIEISTVPKAGYCLARSSQDR